MTNFNALSVVDPGDVAAGQQVAAERPGPLRKAVDAVLHFFTEQIHTTPTDGASEHFGHALKRNDLKPAIDVPTRRLSGLH